VENMQEVKLEEGMIEERQVQVDGIDEAMKEVHGMINEMAVNVNE